MSKLIKDIAEVATALVLSQVYVVDLKGQLHSLKPLEWAEVNKNPSLLEKMLTLKHNPTNVHGKGLDRLSDQSRRPLYIEVASKGNKSTFKETPVTPAPEVKPRVVGEKKEKVAKADGPRTFYVVGVSNDLRSLDAVQFKAAQEDVTTLAYCKSLKHNPTCVEKSLLAGGLVSIEDDTRPMYWVVNDKLVRIWSSPEAKVASEALALLEKEVPEVKIAKSKVKKAITVETPVEVTETVELEVTA